jgi:hypothetical protein
MSNDPQWAATQVPEDLPSLLPLNGGCLCGRVRYQAQPEHRQGYYCHCRMCQLAFGNTRAAYLNLLKSEVKWLTVPPTYYASSRIARRGFCNQCGTPLSFEFLDGHRMDLSVGSLDDPAAITPCEHFSIETRLAGWHAPDGLPEVRLDANPRIVGLWRAAYGENVEPGIEAGRKR